MTQPQSFISQEQPKANEDQNGELAGSEEEEYDEEEVEYVYDDEEDEEPEV